MKEFIDEYGAIIAISIIGLAIVNGLWEVLKMVCMI
jgi:hypothetical protein